MKRDKNKEGVSRMTYVPGILMVLPFSLELGGSYALPYIEHSSGVGIVLVLRILYGGYLLGVVIDLAAIFNGRPVRI